MQVGEEKIMPCSFCLKSCRLRYYPIDDGLRKMITILLLKHDLENEEMVLCNDCVENLRICYELKKTLLSSHEYLKLAASDNGQYNFVDIVSDEHMKCCLCRRDITSEIHISSNKNGRMLRSILTEYFPELVTNAFTVLSICDSCNMLLDTYLNIMKYWSGLEKNNKDVTPETILNREINLNHIADLKLEYESNKKVIATDKVPFDGIKDEINLNTHDLNSAESHMPEFKIKSEEIDIGMDELDCNRIEDTTSLKLKLTDEDDFKDHLFIGEKGIEVLKDPDVGKIPTQEQMTDNMFKINCNMYHDSVNVETEESSFKDVRKRKFNDEHKGHKKFKSVNKEHYKMRSGIQQNSSEVSMYQCEKCEYKTAHQCYLKQHLVVHQNSSEATMYQCEKCDFKTKNKYYIKNHCTMHQDSSEVMMYQCENCDYKTRYKSSLQRHSIIHKDASNVQMYGCEKCEYRTRHKRALDGHLINHKDSTEVTMYQCEKCEYSTRQKGNIRKHLLVHQDASDIKIYQCESCDFKTRHRSRFKQHLIVHQTFSEATIYQCDKCEYKTKYKGCLKTHFITHQDKAGTMYQCENCDYTTSYKGSLQRHSIIHKDSSNVQLYKCEKCKFKTRHKNALYRHFLMHKDSTEVTMYQCEQCGYKTRQKDYLRKHLLVHQNASDVKIYQCDSCDFKTNRNSLFKIHIVRHQSL